MLKAFIANWKLNQQKTENEEAPRSLAARRRADYAGYGDNGTEAEWMVVDNFK